MCRFRDMVQAKYFQWWRPRSRHYLRCDPTDISVVVPDLAWPINTCGGYQTLRRYDSSTQQDRISNTGITVIVNIFLLLLLPPTHCRCRELLFHLITHMDTHTPAHTNTHTHTHKLGGTLLDEISARRRDLYLYNTNIHNRQISMLPKGFEPAFPTS